MAEKLAIVCTSGLEDPERATIPFVLATATLASNVDVIMGFQINGVLLMKRRACRACISQRLSSSD